MAVLDCFNYVASKGDVKAFFGLRFGRFSARVQMVVWVFLHLQCPDGVLHRLGMCSVAPKIVLCGFQR